MHIWEIEGGNSQINLPRTKCSETIPTICSRYTYIDQDESQNDAIKEMRTCENVHTRCENLTKRTVQKLTVRNRLFHI